MHFVGLSIEKVSRFYELNIQTGFNGVQHLAVYVWDFQFFSNDVLSFSDSSSENSLSFFVTRPPSFMYRMYDEPDCFGGYPDTLLSTIYFIEDSVNEMLNCSSNALA